METKENTIYLLSKKNKGLKNFLFTRLPMFIVLIAIEVAILAAIFGWFRDIFPYFAVVQTVFAVGMVIYLFNCSMDYSAKLTWLFLIIYAAERGVDVKLILPGIPDKKTAYALAKSHYKSLVSSGVKIYEYTPGFVHAKVFVSDDIKAVVGTINLDYRSLYHHFECAAYMYKTDCIADIEKDFRYTLSKCREVTLESIKNETFYYKVLGSIMKIIAPLM